MLRINVSLLQRLARVQRRGASGRRPQAAKSPCEGARQGVNSVCCANLAKRSSGAFCREGQPAIEVAPRRIAARFAAQDLYRQTELPHIAVRELHHIRAMPDAGGGGRTRTVSLPTDFESVTSANSITPAHGLLYHISDCLSTEKRQPVPASGCRLFISDAPAPGSDAPAC